MFRGNTKKFKLLLNLWSRPALFEPQAKEALLLDRIYHDQILLPLSRVIQEGVGVGEIAPIDPEALTVALAAMIDGLMLYSLVWPEGIVSDERLEAVLLHLLRSGS